MKTINLGESGLEASAIALGCMRISEMSVTELTALINKCFELGINFFDHADIYGNGVCEELFGKVLMENPPMRRDMLIQSKCGIRNGFFDFSGQYILDSTEGILKRLGVDSLDILLLHRSDTLMEPDEIAKAFNALYESGKVKHFGVSNMNPAQIDFLQDALGQKLIVNQLQFSAAHTGMIDNGIYVNMKVEQSNDRDGSILEYCRRKKITIQTWSSLQYGFFEGTFLNSDKHPKLNDVLMCIADERGVEKSAVAIAWILRHPAKMQVVPGTTNPARLTALVKSIDIELDRQEWYEIYQSAGNILP